MEEQLSKKTQALSSIRLRSDEKAQVGAIINAYCLANPLPRSGGIFAFIHPVPAMAFGVLVAMFVGNYLMEISLPGDLAYSAKIIVRENIIGNIRITDESKILYDINLAEQEQKEAEALAVKNGI